MIATLSKQVTLDFSIFFGDLQGKFEGLQFTDNLGLSLGLASGRTLETSLEFTKLAVLARTEEGSGALILNLGKAFDGTLIGGQWEQEPSGSFYIRNANVSFLHHPSMVGVIKLGDETGSVASGAVLVRNATAGALVTKSGLFSISILNNGNQLFFTRVVNTPSQQEIDQALAQNQTGKKTTVISDNVQVGQKTLTNTIELPLNTSFFSTDWVLISFIINARATQLFVNGTLFLDSRIEDKLRFDPGNPLIFGGSDFIGDMDKMFYLGAPSVTQFHQQLNPTSGTWTSQPIQLSTLPEFSSAGITSIEELIFERADWTGFANDDHGLQVNIRMGNDPTFSAPKVARLDLAQDRQNFTKPIYSPDTYVFGKYLQVFLSMNRTTVSQLSPSLKTLKLRFRVR